MRWEPPGPRDLQTPARTTRLARSNLVGVSGRHRPEMGINQRPLLQRQRAISGCPHTTGRSGGGFCSVQLARKHNELSVCLHSLRRDSSRYRAAPTALDSIHPPHRTTPHHIVDVPTAHESRCVVRTRGHPTSLHRQRTLEHVVPAHTAPSARHRQGSCDAAHVNVVLRAPWGGGGTAFRVR